MESSPIKQTSLADRAEANILNLIRESGYSAGDQLPSENELAERLGISRGVVREALSRLRMLGLLVSRKKRGMVLCEPDILGGVRRVMDPLLVQDQTAQELFELRLVIEMGMVDLLFLRRNEVGLRELEQIAERLETAPSEEVRIQAEVDFHAALYRMSGNKTLSEFQSLLRGFFREAAARERDAGHRSNPVSHRKLLETLTSGTPEEFRATMRAHLDPHFQRLRRSDD